MLKQLSYPGDMFLRQHLLFQPIHEIISRDEEIHKIQSSILKGMQDITSVVQEPLSYWDQFREIWEVNKVNFISRYRKLNPHVSSLDADIGRWEVGAEFCPQKIKAWL